MLFSAGQDPCQLPKKIPSNSHDNFGRTGLQGNFRHLLTTRAFLKPRAPPSADILDSDVLFSPKYQSRAIDPLAFGHYPLAVGWQQVASRAGSAKQASELWNASHKMCRRFKFLLRRITIAKMRPGFRVSKSKQVKIQRHGGKNNLFVLIASIGKHRLSILVGFKAVRKF